MPILISISQNDEASAALRTLADERGMRVRLLSRLAPEWSKAGQIVVGRAVKERFTGKGPFPVSQNKLGVRTGRLRRSVRATLAQVNATTGEVSLQAGSNVSYFASHEFGFKGRVQVRSHQRRTGKQLRAKVGGGFTTASVRGRVRALRNAELGGTRRRGRVGATQVRAHTRRVDVPERAPLGTELRSERARQDFMAAQGRAVRMTYLEFLKQGGGR